MENKTPAVTAAEARRRYQRAWYQKNKARCRERQQQFWQRQADKLNAESESERGRADVM